MAKMKGYYRPDRKETKRADYRARVDIDGFYRLGTDWVACKIYDLSIGGAGLKLNQFFVEGDQLDLKVGQSDEAMELVAHVCNVNGQRVGIQFDIDGTAERKLERIINKAAANSNPGKPMKFDI